MSDDIADQIEADVRRLEEHSSYTGGLRKKVVDKLTQAVEDMTIDPNTDKASTLEAKMGVINTLLKAISDTDDQKINLIKLKQRVKADNETEDSLKVIASTVSAYMRKIDTKLETIGQSSPVSKDHQDINLDAVLETSGLDPILDAELELTTISAKDIEK